MTFHSQRSARLRLVTLESEMSSSNLWYTIYIIYNKPKKYSKIYMVYL